MRASGRVEWGLLFTTLPLSTRALRMRPTRHPPAAELGVCNQFDFNQRKKSPAPVDVDCVLLADAVRARHGLQVVLWIPVCGSGEGHRAGWSTCAPTCAAASLDKASSLLLICTRATGARAMCASASTRVIGTNRSVEQYTPSPLTRVEDDDGIGGGQVDTQAAGSRGQQEGKVGGTCGRGRWQGWQRVRRSIYYTAQIWSG